MFQSKEIKEQLAKIDADQRAIYNQAKEEKRESLNEEETQKFDKLQEEYSTKKRELQRVEQLEEREQSEATKQDEAQERNKDLTPEKRYEGVFEKYIRYGLGSLSSEERDSLKSNKVSLNTRAQSTTNSAGGYLIPQGFSGEVEKGMKDYSGILQTARIVQTSSVGQLDWPTNDDTANKGRLISEGADASSGATDLTFGTKALDAFKYTSDLIKVNAELIEDEAIGIEALLNEILAERLGRIANEHLTTGSGSSQPNGVVTASAKGADAAAVAAISRDDLVEMVHGVNTAYRRMNARFMMNDNTLKAIKKLSFGSSDDRPLYLGGDARNGDPATIEGYQFTINDDMADIGASARSVLFGSFSKYLVRQVRGIMVKRADERYIETDQVAFVGFARWDGELLNTAAVKHLLHPAS